MQNIVATRKMIETAAEMYGKFPRHYIELILRTSHRATHAQADDACRAVAINGGKLPSA